MALVDEQIVRVRPDKHAHQKQALNAIRDRVGANFDLKKAA